MSVPSRETCKPCESHGNGLRSTFQGTPDRALWRRHQPSYGRPTATRPRQGTRPRPSARTDGAPSTDRPAKAAGTRGDAGGSTEAPCQRGSWRAGVARLPKRTGWSNPLAKAGLCSDAVVRDPARGAGAQDRRQPGTGRPTRIANPNGETGRVATVDCESIAWRAAGGGYVTPTPLIPRLASACPFPASRPRDTAPQAG